MIRFRIALAISIGAALVPPAAMGQAAPGVAADAHDWRVDPVHSAVQFRVRHLGITWVNGAFREWSASLTYDPDHPEAAFVAVHIRAASIETQNARRDDDVRANYLVVDSFPEITFTSTRVEPVGADHLRITGDLTIRGVTHPVVLDTEIGGVLRTAGGRRVAFSATTSIKRQDFGITRNMLLEGAQIVGDEVRITIDVEADTPPIT